MTDASPSTPDRAIPTAVIKPERRVSLVWLIPLAAILFAAWIGWRAWQARGVSVTVQLEEGHGLKIGDDVRFRGINVGKIDDVVLADDLRSVIVTARLTSQAERLARSGTRFWVVRPQLGLTRIEGLDTIIGPRFLAVLPSDDPRGRAQHRFVGLAAAPIVESTLPGDLEIVLESANRGSLAPGAPVYYRQTRIGVILSVGLAGDGGSVEARLHIQQPYVQLVRAQTRFWDVGGMQATVGFTGVSIDIESAEALLIGGVALATPPSATAGEVVRTGHRFTLEAQPRNEWLAWRPQVAIGSSLLPPEAGSPPAPLRARLRWEQGRIFSSEQTRQGWVLQTDEGLIGPVDLLKASEDADAGSVALEVAGETIALVAGGDASPKWERHGLALIEANLAAQPVWRRTRIRAMNEPEECVAIAGSITGALPLAAARLTQTWTDDGQPRGWNIDPAVTIDESWHGACVLARSDGKLLGMLIVSDDEDQVRIAPVMPAGE